MRPEIVYTENDAKKFEKSLRKYNDKILEDMGVSEEIRAGASDLEILQYYFKIAVKSAIYELKRNKEVKPGVRGVAEKIASDLIKYLSYKAASEHDIEHDTLKVYALALYKNIQEVSTLKVQVNDSKVGADGRYQMEDGVSSINIGNNRYEIISKLGEGGNGAVYKCRNQNGEEFALKVMADPNIRENDPGYILDVESIRENRVSAAIGRGGSQYPIVNFQECGYLMDNGKLHSFTVLEKCSGSLRDEMDNNKTPAARRVFLESGFPLKMLQGIVTIHDTEWVHKDLKPENFMLLFGNVKLIDFGSVDTGKTANQLKFQEEAEKNLKFNKFIETVTHGYVSGEDTKGGQKLDAKTDIYALGCILFEMYTGQSMLDFLQNNDELNGDNKRRPFKSYVGAKPGDVDAVKAKLAQATTELGLDGDHPDYVEKFLNANGFETPKGLSALILSMVDPDKTKRPTINEAVQVFEWWQNKQNNDQRPLPRDPVLVIHAAPPSASPVPPLYAVDLEAKTRADEVNLTQTQPMHLYLANLRAARVSDDNPEVQGVKMTLGVLEQPVVAPVAGAAALPAAAAVVGAAAVMPPAAVVPVPARISPAQEQSDNQKLHLIKSAINDQLSEKYEKDLAEATASGVPGAIEEVQKDYLTPGFLPGIGVYSGIPQIVKHNINGINVTCFAFTILDTVENGAAENAGLQVGDKILVQLEGSRARVGTPVSIKDELACLEKIRSIGAGRGANGVNVYRPSEDRMIDKQIATTLLDCKGYPGGLANFNVPQIQEQVRDREAKGAGVAAAR